ncbi:hypothetical protein GGR38_004802 [Novosphingobium sediminicola]|uniref:Uncharacterized protein n=1 Tax=Novosphingobium sediminicola TaxID=563162 RepID=A0A7W6CL75_9SPHN|nr:hypothetical protein [Novosphingobium sediminicola]
MPRLMTPVTKSDKSFPSTENKNVDQQHLVRINWPQWAGIWMQKAVEMRFAFPPYDTGSNPLGHGLRIGALRRPQGV